MTNPTHDFVLSEHRDEDGRLFVLRLLRRPDSNADVVELCRSVEDDGERRDYRIRLTPDAARELATFLRARYEQEHTPLDTLAACLTAAVQAHHLSPRNIYPFERWCEQAGIESEATELAPDGTVTFRRRQVPLVRYHSSPRRTSTLWLTFDLNRRFYSDKPGRLMFTETHQPAGTDDGRFLDSVVLSDTEIPALLQALRVLVDQPPVPANIEDQLVACFGNLIARGRLGPHLRLRENTERVGTWCEQAGIPFTAAPSERRETLVEAPRSADGPKLTLSLRLGGREGLLFEETHRVGQDFANQSRYTVTADYAHLPALAERLATRVNLPTEQRTGEPEDELVASFQALIERGELGGELPRRANRDRVAAWLAEAALPHRLVSETAQALLRVYRQNTDCVYTLSVRIRSGGREDTISFREDYEYLPQRGDPGRSYGYSVKTPYASLAALTNHLEQRLGPGDSTTNPDDRLIACFTRLVEQGVLGDGQPLRANRDKVFDVFTEAGVPATNDDDHWFNSE